MPEQQNPSSVNPDGTPNIVPPPPAEGASPAPAQAAPKPAPATETPRDNDASLRTMESDAPASPASLEPEAAPSLDTSAFDTSEPAFTPETNTVTPGNEDFTAPKNHHTMLWIIVGIVIVALGAGYFLIAPLLTGDTEPTAPAEPVATTTPETPVPATPQYESPFMKDTPQRTAATGAVLTLDSFRAGLVAVAEEAPQGFTEVLVMHNEGPVAAEALLTLLMPEVAASSALSETLSGDATVYVHKDEAGAWPGYVAMLQEGTTEEARAALGAAIEAGMIENLFIVSPGELEPFRDGTVFGLPDRYAPGATPGASFGYLTTDNILLLSTSFDGMKEALRHLGLDMSQ